MPACEQRTKPLPGWGQDVESADPLQHAGAQERAWTPTNAGHAAAHSHKRSLSGSDLPKLATSCNGRTPVAYEQCGFRPDRRPVLTELAIHQVLLPSAAAASSRPHASMSYAVLPLQACMHCAHVRHVHHVTAAAAWADPSLHLQHGHDPHRPVHCGHTVRLPAPGQLASLGCHAGPPDSCVSLSAYGCLRVYISCS